MFLRKKKLYESNPKTLDLETLLLLHNSLLAKSLIVTAELRDRFNALASLKDALEPKFKDDTDFAVEAKRMNGIYLVLENVLAQQLGNAPK